MQIKKAVIPIVSRDNGLFHKTLRTRRGKNPREQSVDVIIYFPFVGVAFVLNDGLVTPHPSLQTSIIARPSDGLHGCVAVMPLYHHNIPGPCCIEHELVAGINYRGSPTGPSTDFILSHRNILKTKKAVAPVLQGQRPFSHR